MKNNRENDVGCLTTIVFWAVIIGGIALLQNLPVNTHKKVPTPVPTRTATPTPAGPSPEDCSKETNEELANLCWDAVEEQFNDMRDNYNHDADVYDEPNYDEPYDNDPFEDERSVE